MEKKSITICFKSEKTKNHFNGTSIYKMDGTPLNVMLNNILKANLKDDTLEFINISTEDRNKKTIKIVHL